MLIRTTVVSLAVQALIERLLLQGMLNTGDLTAMREMGLRLAADLQASPAPCHRSVARGLSTK